ncbi:MAG: thiol reductase thioredoxin [Candidatus Hydrothermarchaeota archaeon]|nr:MAG: thiol reductase thioredoxin [Candidatus Hydrothermarchaeota archaeon]
MRRVTIKNFWSYDSDECNIQIPIIKDLEEIFKGRVVFENINAEENKEEVERYGIKEFPTIIVECNGREKERFIGLTQELFLKKAIERALSECQ